MGFGYVSMRLNIAKEQGEFWKQSGNIGGTARYVKMEGFYGK